MTFVKSLLNCDKFSVRFLARLCQADNRTVIGKTTQLLSDKCGVEKSKAKFLTANQVKKSLKYFNIPEGEEWRPPLVRELINIRNGQLDLQGFSKEEIKLLLKNQCES